MEICSFYNKKLVINISGYVVFYFSEKNFEN